jgi:hypothetical protein
MGIVGFALSSRDLGMKITSELPYLVTNGKSIPMVKHTSKPFRSLGC